MQATISDVVDALQRANCHPTQRGETYTSFCPVHEADGTSHKPSLSVARGDKVPVVLNCHAGCSHDAIIAALGLETKAASNDGSAGASRRIVATYPYHDASGAVVFEKIRYFPKDFRIRHRDASGAEIWKLPAGTEPPLYRLPEVVAAIAAGEPVYLAEGEKDAERLAAAGLCASTNFDGAAAGTQKPKWRDSYTAALAGADVVLIPDNDEPGMAHMRHAAAALAGTAARVRWLELPGLHAKGDVSDWLNQGHTIDELMALAAVAPDTGAPAPEGTTSTDSGTGDESEVARLAALNPIEYDRQRVKAAKALGIRGDTLDKMVKAARGESDKASNGGGGGGTAVEFPDIEPWPARVDGAALLNDLAASVRMFMSLPEHADFAIALWTLASHIILDHCHIAPILAVVSPEKRCGKTTLLGWLYRLVARPLQASNITASAVFRTVDAYQPTLIIDEADSFLGETGDELRGILNSGHTKDAAYVIRVCGENLEPRRFSTWGTKAVALIGKLEGRYSTLADRSIEIQLRRKLPSEKLMKLRHADEGHFNELARKCARFSVDHGAAIGKARPDIPDYLNDRACDNWEPLLAIADVAGGNWPRLARTVAMALSGGSESDDAAIGGGSLGVQLLGDLRRYFDGGNSTCYPTATLLQHLIEIGEAPWATYAKGRPMTPRHLARLLHPYGIRPADIRIGNTVVKGYTVAAFTDAFGRYLPSIRNTATSQSNSGKSANSSSATDSACSGYTKASSASQTAACSGVADKTPGTAAADGVADGVADDAATWFEI
jgi:hypothetical protein